MAGKPRSPPTDWRAVFEQAREQYSGFGNPPFALNRLAWQWTCGEWWRWQGTPVAPTGICAGCGEPIGSSRVIELLHGDAIHGRDDCLRRYGAKWRAEADTALRALGLERPEPVGDA
jgi:hypothetical protein